MKINEDTQRTYEISCTYIEHSKISRYFQTLRSISSYRTHMHHLKEKQEKKRKNMEKLKHDKKKIRKNLRLIEKTMIINRNNGKKS